MRAGVVGREKRPDDKLALLDRRHAAADLFDDAAVLVPHRGWLGSRVRTAIRPKIRPADACRRQPDDRVGGLDDGRGRPLFKAHIARTVQNCSLHDSLPL